MSRGRGARCPACGPEATNIRICICSGVLLRGGVRFLNLQQLWWPLLLAKLESAMHSQSANRKHMTGGNKHMHMLMFLVPCHATGFGDCECQQLCGLTLGGAWKQHALTDRQSAACGRMAEQMPMLVVYCLVMRRGSLPGIPVALSSQLSSGRGCFRAPTALVSALPLGPVGSHLATHAPCRRSKR